MKKEFPIETSEPGITVYNSKTSSAFMLICFMVGDLLLIYKTLAMPVNMELYEGFDEKKFNLLKNKILQNQAAGKFTHLNMDESILIYMIVDIVCKCFVNDANETLKTMAIESIKVSEEEYEQLRLNFLRYGQSLIEKMNDKFKTNAVFISALSGLKNWNESG